MCNLSLLSMPLNVPVISIGQEAFVGCKMSELNIPSVLTTIDKDAFVSNTIKKLVIDSDTIASTNISYNDSSRVFDNVKVLYIKNTISSLNDYLKSHFIFHSTSGDYNIYTRYNYSKNIVVETITD